MTGDIATGSAADPHPRRQVEVVGTTMSYVDTGSGDPVVFLHGNPTSSYLWRNIIPYVRQGPVTLVVHDWGSALGFHWAHRNPERVRGIAYMEAIVQPRVWADFPPGRAELFRAMRGPQGESLILDDNFFVETVLPKSILRTLNESEMEAYRAPFRTRESRLPILVFPRDLPIDGTPDDVVATVEAYGRWLAGSDIPKLLVSAEPGSMLVGRTLEFARTWPNQEEITVPGIHYLQEDAADEIGSAIRRFVGASVDDA